MIRLQGVSRTARVGGGPRWLLHDASVDLPTDRRVALLGPPQSGKSTVIRLLAGLETPTAGTIMRFADVSFPVGYNRALRPHLSPRQNVAHAARVYGVDPEEATLFVQSITELEDAFDAPTLRLTPGERAALAYAIAYAIPFDVYLIDEHAGVGSPRFRETCATLLTQRLEHAGLILATRDWRKARQLCTEAVMILDGQLVRFDDMAEATAMLDRLTTGDHRDDAADAPNRFEGELAYLP